MKEVSIDDLMQALDDIQHIPSDIEQFKKQIRLENMYHNLDVIETLRNTEVRLRNGIKYAIILGIPVSIAGVLQAVDTTINILRYIGWIPY